MSRLKENNLPSKTRKPRGRRTLSTGAASLFNSTVLVSGLGYFVDIYDLLLFGIVRVASLKDLGLPDHALLETGIVLVNLQMVGMLAGGILWGIIGDKKGRVSVLFGSILIYSISNILNSFVQSVEMYGVLRFTAGVGLAGELGAAITLVSETLNRESRGYGTTFIATIGILGAVCAGIVGDLFHWRTSYLIGGGMGILLLLMRLSIYESALFKTTKSQDLKKGDLRMLFYPRSRFLRYLRCILIGVPIWFAIGIAITFAPELALELRVSGPVTAGRAILFCYLGGSIGNLCCGFLSQIWQSRKGATFLFLILLLGMITFILSSRGLSPFAFYGLCAAIGFSTGYWSVFMTIAAEQFGTNLRATVTTTVPNFVRASVIGLTFVFHHLGKSIGLVPSAGSLGVLSIGIALFSLYWIRETFGKNLDFFEHESP